MEDTYVRLVNCRLHPFRSSASSFSSQYLLLLLKSSRSCVLLLLPTPFTCVISPLMALWRRQFLLRIWPTQLAFLRRILFRSVLFSPIRFLTSSLVTFKTILSSPFSSSTTFQSSPNIKYGLLLRNTYIDFCYINHISTYYFIKAI